jgi:cell wall assembly regulator SMI1
VQEFTRPITREIQLADERLALTFSDKGISVRIVGTRKPPRELSWASLFCRLMPAGAEPKPEEIAAALKALKAGTPPPAATAAKTPEATVSTTAPSDASTLLARLGKWFTEHRPRYAKGLRPGADPAKLEALRARLGMELPPELRALLTWHDGQGTDFTGSFEQSWALMSADRIGAGRQEMLTDAASGWQPAWVPFLEDGRDNFLFLDTSRPGNPVRSYWQGNHEQAVAAPSLTAWLQDFVTTVEHGGYVEDPERGDFLRRS